MSPDRNEVAQLLAGVAAGDTKAFRRLYQLTNRKLYAIALRILRSPPDADDAVQEIYVKIWERASFYRAGTASPISWLATVARNHAIDICRAKRPPMLDVARLISLTDGGLDAEKMMLVRETTQHIGASIDLLPLKSAELIRGAYLDELSYKELADRHKLSLNTVRTQLRRGLWALSQSRHTSTEKNSERAT